MSMAVPVAVTLWLGAVPLAAQQSPVRLLPMARFGCADCAGPTLFSTISDIAWLADGRLLVLSGEAPFVRVFTPAGEPVAAFGTEGSGPGELRTPIAAAPVGADGVDVIDIRLLRITRYGLDGRPRDTRAVARAAFPLAAARIPDAGAWLLVTTDFRTPTPVVRRLDDGADAAVVVLPSSPDFPRDREGNPTAFGAFASAPDGSFVMGEGMWAYRIRRFGPDGAARGEIVRDLPRPRRTDSEMEREEDRRARMADRLRAMRAAEGGGPGPLRPVSGEKNYFDAGALAFDSAGRLWVRTTRGDDARTIFDVFSESGALLGEVTVEGLVGRYAFGRSVLAAVVTGEDEVPRVATWRVKW